MMKTLYLFFIVLILTAPKTYARDFGLGAILGDPTGISAKTFLGKDMAVDGAIAYGGHEFILYADYLKHFPRAFGKQNAFISSLNPYVGIGPVFMFNDGKHDDEDFELGARIPLGVEWMTPEIPVGISLEIVPGMSVVPETDAFVQGGLAVRYYFK